MAKDVPAPFPADFASVKQAAEQHYAFVLGVENLMKLTSEFNAKVSDAQNRLQLVEQDLFAKDKLLRDVTAKLEVTQRLFVERTEQAEKARMELSSVESRLDAANAKMQSILKTFSPKEKA